MPLVVLLLHSPDILRSFDERDVPAFHYGSRYGIVFAVTRAVGAE